MRFIRDSLNLSWDWVAFLLSGLISLYKLILVSPLSYWKLVQLYSLKSLARFHYQLIPGLDLLESLSPSLNHLPLANYQCSPSSDDLPYHLYWLTGLFSVKSIFSVSPRSLEFTFLKYNKFIPGVPEFMEVIY